MSGSAAKHKGKVGVEDFAATRVYIRGEGWVKWLEIKEQVARAYDQWRIRRAMAGKKTWDAAESRASEIQQALSARGDLVNRRTQNLNSGRASSHITGRRP